MAVHMELGPGFIESVYENALAIELRERGIHVVTQVPIDLLYHGQPIGQHRLDMLAEHLLVIENKAVRALEPVFYAIIRSYMKATGKQHAVMFNYASTRLEIKRVYPHQ